VRTRAGVAIEGTLAHRLFNLHLASLHLELPVLGVPSRDVNGAFSGSYSSIFFTPGLRVKFSLPGISPFVSVGGGLAHLSNSASLTNSISNSSTTGAFQVGGGIDVKTPIPFLGLRGEVREFYTGRPNFATPQNNLFVGGGIVFRF
jgi:hypothetical protein